MEILNTLSEKKKYRKVKYFSIDAELNEIKNFYHDQTPILLLYSKKDLLNPRVYEGGANQEAIKNFIKMRKNVEKKKKEEIFFNKEL